MRRDEWQRLLSKAKAQPWAVEQVMMMMMIFLPQHCME
jgi:hypothetical protein